MSLTVASVSDRTSVFAMPPPKPPGVFCVTTTLIRFKVATWLVAVAPELMPPPSPAPGLPLRIVTPEMVVVPLADTSNTRSSWFPSMITLPAPAPAMVTASRMSRSPVAAMSSPRPASASLKR